MSKLWLHRAGLSKIVPWKSFNQLDIGNRFFFTSKDFWSGIFEHHINLSLGVLTSDFTLKFEVYYYLSCRESLFVVLWEMCSTYKRWCQMNEANGYWSCLLDEKSAWVPSTSAVYFPPLSSDWSNTTVFQMEVDVLVTGSEVGVPGNSSPPTTPTKQSPVISYNMKATPTKWYQLHRKHRSVVICFKFQEYFKLSLHSTFTKYFWATFCQSKYCYTRVDIFRKHCRL